MPETPAFAPQSAIAYSPTQSPVRIPRKHGRESSKRSADVSPRSTLGRRPCSSRDVYPTRVGASATAMLSWTSVKRLRCVAAPFAGLLPNTARTFRMQRQHRQVSLPTAAHGQALAAVRADCRPEALLRAPIRSETLSDSPAKCSCDVRPVKVKPCEI